MSPYPNPAPQPCCTQLDLIFDPKKIYNQETFVNGNSFTWTAPYGIYQIILQVQANGGGGAQGGDDFGGCGGLGGDCLYYSYPVVPGQSYSVVIDGTGIYFDGGGITVLGDTSPQSGPICDESPQGTDGGYPECPGGGGYGGTAGQDYGEPGQDGVLGGGGGGAGAGGTGGYGGEGWVRVFYVSQFGNNNISNHYPSKTHQTHQTGPTTSSIPHCVPLNQYTTTKGIGMRRKWVLAGALAATPIPLPPFCGRQVQVTFVENTNWVLPTGVTKVYVECIGGGGGGGDGNSGVDEDGGGGGGGGAYAASLLTLTPGVYPIQVGAGGTGDGDDGVASDFNSGQVSADFGIGATGSTAGTGGLATNSVGDFVWGGNDGINGITGSIPAVSGSAGGDAAGGGAGGAGGAPNAAGSPGGYPGGGGGGGGSTFGVNGGAAAAKGQVRITYQSDYGHLGDIHQFHNTGQTNYSLLHCTPINKYTTTKGIGMRRKWFLGIEPPPPPPPPFTAPAYMKYVFYAATATEPTPVEFPQLNCCPNNI